MCKMPSSDYFSIARSFPALDTVQNFGIFKWQSCVLLCSWKRTEVTIHLREDNISYSMPQVLKTRYVVIAVLNVKDSVICIDIRGNVFKVEGDSAVKNPGPEAFDSYASCPSSPILGSGKMKEELYQVNFKLTELLSLSDCEEVFYASYIPEAEQVVVLSKANTRIFLVAYDSSTMKAIFISKIPYSSAEIRPQKSIIMACHSKYIDAQLKNVLFPALEAPAFVEFVVLIIALSNGSILWTTSKTSCNGLQLLHKWHQSIAAVTFFSLGESKTFNVLCLASTEGPVMLLHSKSKKLSVSIQFLPSAAKAVYCNSNGSILSSDFTDCSFNTFQALEKNFHSKTCSVAVKGVVKFSQSPDNENIIVALTKLGFAYEIFIDKIEPLEVSQRFSMPKRGVLEDCLETCNTLDNLLLQIKEENDELAAISLTMRASILHQFFHVSVKVYSGPGAAKYGSVDTSLDSHLIVIRVVNKCSFYEFSPKLWFLNVILSISADTIKSFHRNVNLKQQFKLDDEIIIHFPAKFAYNLNDPSLKVRLISKQTSPSTLCPWLIIPLKRISVNAAYLLNPLKNPTAQSIEADVFTVEKYIKKLESADKLSFSERSQLKYFIKLPEQISGIKNIFSLVLNYSKFRCKENVWNHIMDDSKSICFANFFGKLVQFSLENGCLCIQVSNADADIFHAMKMAIINLLASLSSNNLISIKKTILIAVQGSLQALEITQISKNSDFKVFQTLRNELRSSVDINLPP